MTPLTTLFSENAVFVRASKNRVSGGMSYLIVKCVFQQLGQYVGATKKTQLNISSSISTRTESNKSLIDDTVQLGRSKRTILNNSSRGEFYL